MNTANSDLGPERAADDLPEITLADVVIELRRIADALTKPVDPDLCGEQRGDAVCVLHKHVGHHSSADGRVHWLDD